MICICIVYIADDVTGEVCTMRIVRFVGISLILLCDFLKLMILHNIINSYCYCVSYDGSLFSFGVAIIMS